MDTTLFSPGAIDLLNTYFTSSMIEEVIDTPGFSDYQRGRLAIAGWTKAMLAGDLESALRLSAQIRRHVPWLAREMEQFEQGQDRHFEAARIIFDYPAFSPWLDQGVGRIHFDRTIRHERQTPDHVTLGITRGWWCASSYRDRTRDEMLQTPLFSRYSDAELAEIRDVDEYRQTAAVTSFGSHVIRYASENLDDPRIPRTLHRLVFTTRIACYSGNGNLSQAAFALLHENFPDSEWAERTPYWYGELD